VASLSQGRTAAAQCGLFTHKSVPVIFEPPCNSIDCVVKLIKEERPSGGKVTNCVNILYTLGQELYLWTR